MSALKELLSKSGTSKDESLSPVWKDQFPLLLEAFFPPPGKASGTLDGPRFSVSVFSDGGRLKLVFGSKTYPRKLWLTLDGPEAVLEQLEIALKSGSGEWREAQEEK